MLLLLYFPGVFHATSFMTSRDVLEPLCRRSLKRGDFLSITSEFRGVDVLYNDLRNAGRGSQVDGRRLQRVTQREGRWYRAATESHRPS